MYTFRLEDELSGACAMAIPELHNAINENKTSERNIT
jgi:hypothetical protein